MEIEPIDIGDDDALTGWYGPFEATERADWPDDPGWSLRELSALMRDDAVEEHVLAVARDGTGVAGSLQVRMPLRESRRVADVWLGVRPTRRGRGIGRALLAHAEEIARRHGRTKVVGSTDAPFASLEGPRRARFAQAAGYEPGLVEVRRVLRLPADPHRLDMLEAAARPFGDRYEIVTWVGRCPADWEEGRVALARSISTDAPQGSLNMEEEDWDVDRLRAFEDTIEAMGRDALTAGAVTSDGALVGFTEITLPRATRTVGYQLDTIVLAAHRGHRLGLLLKIANLRAVEAFSPTTQRLLTWNAASNEPMARVNETLGFELVGTETVWQKLLE